MQRKYFISLVAFLVTVALVALTPRWTGDDSSGLVTSRSDAMATPFGPLPAAEWWTQLDEPLERARQATLRRQAAEEATEQWLLMLEGERWRQAVVAEVRRQEEQRAREAQERRERQEAATRAAAAQRPASTPSAVPDGSVWDRLAQCESGGNWHINTGNGYYGGLQFLPSTWRSVGGTGLPHEHSREEQIHRAQILQQRAGWGQWPACSRKLGLR